MAIFLISVFGILVRCLPWRFVFTSEGIFFPGVDPYYHFLNATNQIQHFPFIKHFDPYLAFPTGAPVPYLIGFDFLVGLPGFFTNDRTVRLFWAVCLPPVLGGIAIYLIYRLVIKYQSKLVGLFIAGFFAFLPAATMHHVLGRVDHHALVAAVVFGSYLFLLNGLQAKDTKHAILHASVGGLLSGYSVACWLATPVLYYLPIPILLVIHLRKNRDTVSQITAITHTLVSLVACILFTFFSVDLAQNPISIFHPSWLSIGLFTLAFLWILFTIKWPRWFLLVPAFSSLFCLAILFGHAKVSWLSRIVDIISGSSDAFSDIVESQPLFFVHGQFSLKRAGSMYGYVFLFWPIIWGFFVYRCIWQKTYNPATFLVTIYILLGGLLSLVQQRFAEFSAGSMALLTGWFLVQVLRRIHYEFLLSTQKRTSYQIFLTLFGLLLISLTVIPIGKNISYLYSKDVVWRSRNLAKFASHLKQAIEKIDRGKFNLSYGILSSEEDSVILLSYLKRPVVTSSFGLKETQQANKIGYRVLLSADERWIKTQLNILHVRYVVTSPIFMRIESMVKVAGLPQQFMSIQKTLQGDDLIVEVKPTVAFANCLHSRLHLADGGDANLFGHQVESLSHFRLLLESSVIHLPNSPSNLFKAFEFVRGAHLKGITEPAVLVRLRLLIRTNTGRELTYQAHCVSDVSGQFEFVVPYATEGMQSPSQTIGPYRIKAGQRLAHVVVTEKSVQLGLAVQVIFGFEQKE